MKNNVRARRYYWINEATQERVNGIALVRKPEGRLVSYMSAQQARAMADRLHDLADDLEATE